MKSIEELALQFSNSFMSNAKWRKFFAEIHQDSMEIVSCTWKLINAPGPITGYLPELQHIGEDYVGDCGALNGPFKFMLIEWLWIPGSVSGKRYSYPNAPTHHAHQDLSAIRKRIAAAGNFEFETTADGIKVFGYKP